MIKTCNNCSYEHANFEHRACQECRKEKWAGWEKSGEHHDTHYQTKTQPLETMQANMTHEEFIGFLKGNIIKYACRSGRKDDPLKEAEKIQRYAGWLVEAIKGNIIDPRN